MPKSMIQRGTDNGQYLLSGSRRSATSGTRWPASRTCPRSCCAVLIAVRRVAIVARRCAVGATSMRATEPSSAAVVRSARVSWYQHGAARWDDYDSYSTAVPLGTRSQVDPADLPWLCPAPAAALDM